MNNDTLLAIPFFTFMGMILERSGMAEDLLDTIGQLFGTIRGGLAYAVIFVGALLAATTGVVAASVISMGLISLPIMLRYGYDRSARDRRHRRIRHAGADHPAVAGADRHGRPARPLGRRHVRGRLHPGLVLSGLYAATSSWSRSFRSPQPVPACRRRRARYRSRTAAAACRRWRSCGAGAAAGYVAHDQCLGGGSDFVVLTMSWSIGVVVGASTAAPTTAAEAGCRVWPSR
jgi:hypothetical protein